MEQISRVLQQGNLIKTSVNDNGTATIQLHRPEKRNALSQAMIDELVAVIDLVEKHDNTRVVVLTGAPGGPFSAGADIKELSALNTTQAYERNWLKDLSDAVQGMRKPIICVVEGLAFGGGFELALLVVPQSVIHCGKGLTSIVRHHLRIFFRPLRSAGGHDQHYPSKFMLFRHRPSGSRTVSGYGWHAASSKSHWQAQGHGTRTERRKYKCRRS